MMVTPAFITLPTEIKTPTHLKKLTKNVFYDQHSKSFFKMNILEPLTVFIGNNIETKQNLVITRYNPAYLVLHYFAQNNTIDLESIPSYMNIQQYQQFGDRHDDIIQVNKTKIFNFLQKKINAVIDLIQERHYNGPSNQFQFMNKNENKDKKIIRIEIVQLLKKDIPQIFLIQIIQQRYNEQRVFKIVKEDIYDEEGIEISPRKNKSKGKKQSKMKVQLPLSKNQKTLGQYFHKK